MLWDPCLSAHRAVALRSLQVLCVLRTRPKGWRLVVATPLVTSLREVETLRRVPQLDRVLLPALLRPDINLGCTGGQVSVN